MGPSLIILGANGNALDVLDIVEALAATSKVWRVAGFLDDSRPAGSSYAGAPVLGGLHDAGRLPGYTFINAIGSEKTYKMLPEILAKTGLSVDQFATLVHPKAGVSSHARLGRGVHVAYGASIAGGVVIGDHVSIGPGCIVGHDSIIQDYAILAPGSIVSGQVQVGSCAYVGAGSVVRQHLSIGENALIGMGAVVTHNVEAGTTVVGNPARPMVCRRHASTVGESSAATLLETRPI
jgi:sugar O-acyltransferase (sialic acid O-acetyltransferase NeuD family)